MLHIGETLVERGIVVVITCVGVVVIEGEKVVVVAGGGVIAHDESVFAGGRHFQSTETQAKGRFDVVGFGDILSWIAMVRVDTARGSSSQRVRGLIGLGGIVPTRVARIASITSMMVVQGGMRRVERHG